MFVSQSQKTLVLDIDTSRINAALFLSNDNLKVLSWRMFSADSVRIVDGVGMHPSALYDFMRDCVKEDSCESIPVNILFSSSVLALDRYVIIASSVVDSTVFKTFVPVGIDWDFMYVGPLDNSSHLFYLHGIHPAVLCAWQIALSKKPFRVQMIIPKTIALFQTYKRMHALTFRRAALALALRRVEYDNDSFFMDIKESPLFSQYVLQMLGLRPDDFCKINASIIPMIPTVLF